MRSPVAQPLFQWEYLAIQETVVPLRPLRITVESENQAIADLLQGKSVLETLNYLGAQGWELVAVIPGLDKNSQVFYFKRPKRD